METLTEAKQYLKDNMAKGISCPLCMQYVKIYPRRLNAGMSKALILVYQLTTRLNPQNGWLHIQREFTKQFKLNATAMDYIQLSRWGLIESKPNLGDPTKKDSGLWRITQKGIDFIYRRIKLPKKATVLNNETMEFTGEEIDIGEALGKRFNYQELMKDYSSPMLPEQQSLII